jgi:hypothetical protein
VPQAEAKYVEIKESNEILARRLTSVINMIQGQILSDDAVLPDMDNVLLALAELKQMKDILSGALEASDAHLLFGEKMNPLQTMEDVDGGAEGAGEGKEEDGEEEEAAGGKEGAEDPAEEAGNNNGGGEEANLTALANAEEEKKKKADPISTEEATALGVAAPLKMEPTQPKGPLQWGDDDEELGEKKTASGGWMDLFK